MRVTDANRFHTMESNLQNNSSKLFSLQQQINSGSKVNKPSDDPVAFQQKDSLETQLTQLSYQKQIVDDQKSKLGVYDTVLGSFESDIQQVRVLVLQASNATTDATAQAGIANQIDAIIQGALQQANQNVSGKYILAGTKTDTPPFVTTGAPGSPTAITYVGDQNFPGIPVADGQSMHLSLDGASVMQSQGKEFFSTLINIRDQIRKGDYKDAGPALQDLTTLEDNLLTRRAETGSATQYLTGLSTTIEQKENDTLSQLQQRAGSDLPTAITEFLQAQTTQQANYSVISTQSRLSLVDYLK